MKCLKILIGVPQCLAGGDEHLMAGPLTITPIPSLVTIP